MKNSLVALGLTSSLFLAGCAGSESDLARNRGSEVSSNSTVGSENIIPAVAATPSGSAGWSNSFQSVTDSIDRRMGAAADRRDAAQARMQDAYLSQDREQSFKRDAKGLRDDYIQMLSLVGVLGVAAKAMNPGAPDCASQKVTQGWVNETNQIFSRAKQVPPT